MDSCAATNVAIRGAGLFFCIVSLVDIALRKVPPIIAKMRVLVSLYMLISVTRYSLYDEIPDVGQGMIKFVDSGVFWPMALYFLENFVGTFLELGAFLHPFIHVTISWHAFRICIFFLFCFVMSCLYCFMFCSIA